MTKRNIVHIEIPTSNAKESADFYQKLFGWNIIRDEKFDYTMFDGDGGPGGGFTKIGGEWGDHVEVGHVLIYINSDDIEADLKQAEALGSKIIQPKMEIPGTGWFGIFTDPTGNTIAVYTDTSGMNQGQS
jgi:predicted enzyme related to lactoylglutathione lyase